jgi:hypothetical protein
MTWTGIVWREAGAYGPGGTFVPQVRLGSHTLPTEPAVGDVVEIDGKEYLVVSVVRGFCHVR